MRNVLLLSVWLGLALLATSARAADDAALQKRLDQLESENRTLKAEYAKAQSETDAAFRDVNAAEAAAGLRVTACSAVSGPGLPDTWPAAGVVHLALRVRHGEFAMTPSAFGPPRMVANHRVQQATMTFTRTPR